MIRLHAEKLAAHLRERLCECYLLSGNEPLLLQESQDLIRRVSRPKFRVERSISIDIHTDWDSIFSLCCMMHLFSKRQILLIILPESGPTVKMGEQLFQLSNLLHSDILLILRTPRLTKSQEKSDWFQSLSLKAAYVNCQAPENNRLPNWVSNRAKMMKLELDQDANQLLCYCYEGNLLALSQTLEKLALLFPDRKIHLRRVEMMVHDVAQFTPLNWLDTLLLGNSKRAWHILYHMQQEDFEITILLRTLQRELMLLLSLQRGVDSMPLDSLFEKHKVWKNRRGILMKAIHRLSTRKLHRAIQELVKIEITLKKDYSQSVWLLLEALSMFLCGEESLPIECTID